MTYDGKEDLNITRNILGLPCLIEDGEWDCVEISYLADGTKRYTIDNNGEGPRYYGSFIYAYDEAAGETQLESIAHGEGRFAATSYTSGHEPVFSNLHHVTDRLGSVVAVVDLDSVGNDGTDAVLEGNGYTPLGERYGIGDFPMMPLNRFRFNGKEHLNRFSYSYIDYGARYYDPSIARWQRPDPRADKYPDTTPYAFCANDPVNSIDYNGRDTVLVMDQASRPQDNGIEGTSYTADIYVIQNGTVSPKFRGSSYPNSRSNSDNSTSYNTVNEGEYPFNNESGHKRGTQKGLNILDSEGERKVPATAPDGTEITAFYINVHSGASDLGNYNSRGSQGCITIHPDDLTSFFSYFNWTNDAQTKGDSTGQILIYRNPTVKKMFNKERIIE